MIERLSANEFRELALSRGLQLTEDEATRIRALVIAAHQMLGPLRTIVRKSDEPIVPGAPP